MLGLVDEQHRAEQSRLAVGCHLDAQGLKAAIAVGRRHADTKQFTQLPVKVAQVALWPLHDPDGKIRYLGKSMGDLLQGLAFSQARIAGDQRKAAVGGHVLYAVGKVFNPGQWSQGLRGQIGQEGIIFQPVQGTDVGIYSWCDFLLWQVGRGQPGGGIVRQPFSQQRRQGVFS